jgi:hypothetical protein
LFKPPGASLPYLLFYVAKEPAVGQAGLAGVEVEAERDLLGIMERSGSVKNMVREHVIHVHF